MLNAIRGRTGQHIDRVALPCISIFLMLLALAAWGADKQKDEETLKNAGTVLQEAINSKTIPSDLLTKSKCVLVLPNVKKFGLGVGGSGGRGALTCREGKNFSGKWSAPAMYSIGGASIGLQAGGSSTDFILLVMEDKGVEAILNDKTKLGTDATAAAGPSGATSASSSVGGADVLTYARAKGLFAGVSLEGATLHQDVDANKRLYGKAMTGRDIVTGRGIETPSGGKPLVSLLNAKTSK